MFNTYRTAYGAGWRAGRSPQIVPNHHYCPATGLALKHLVYSRNPYQWRRNPLKFIAWENGFYAGQMSVL